MITTDSTSKEHFDEFYNMKSYQSSHDWFNLNYPSLPPSLPLSHSLHLAFVLSCAFPKEPANGEVSVTHLHAGGEAYFQCLTGYQLQGPTMLTCRNATTPYWSGKEPKCLGKRQQHCFLPAKHTHRHRCTDTHTDFSSSTSRIHSSAYWEPMGNYSNPSENTTETDNWGK